MKIAVTATDASLESRIDPRFGRCAYFLIVDTNTMEFEAIENPNVALGGGAGIQSAQLLAENAVEVVLTGNCGPNAHQTLSAAGIGVMVGCTGSVVDAVEQFKAGQLNAATEPNVASKFGMAGPPNAAPDQPGTPRQPQMPGGGMGMGRGMGRGAGMGGGGGMGGGMGRGRGMGRGMGRGRGMGGGGGMGGGMGRGGGMGPGMVGNSQGPQNLTPPSKEDELSLLKQQAEAMAQHMQEIQERIRQLEEDS
jgi:predicted Fe-Mo cluster-binding NifX family protein